VHSTKQHSVFCLKFRPSSPRVFYLHAVTAVLGTQFPASVTKRAASGSHGPFSRMVQGSVNTSLEISSLSRIKDSKLIQRRRHLPIQALSFAVDVFTSTALSRSRLQPRSLQVLH
jgi:hypothetical protein